jgi:F-type H+-transporting ATPase subunit gamma
MPGLKEVRIRISSVKSTQQITNAMKMVAASKLRKAQMAVVRLRPYAAQLRNILQNLAASIEDSAENAFTKERSPEKILIVAFASNRGLCGGFNSNVIKTVLNLLDTTYSSQHQKGNVYLFCVGRKVSEYFTKRNYNVVGIHDDLLDHISFEKVAEKAEKLTRSYLDQQYDRIILIYNQFKNAAVQRLVVEPFLPIEPVTPVTVPVAKKATVSATDYLFEPDKETIIRELIPKTLRIQLYKAILDSFASEQGARMTAMQQATDNAREILKELQLSYNKARQAAITKEILEIVSGAEALKG